MTTNAANESYLLMDELEETLASGSARERSLMLSRVADLFVHGAGRYNAQQIALFDDVLLRLTAEIEMKARAKLAQRLAYMDNAPPKLIRRFAFDDAIDVARPVLTYSPRLSEADLTENAGCTSQDHLYAIGRRLEVSEAITDVLVTRGNDRVVRALVHNSGAHFSPAGFGELTNRAAGDCVLAFGMVQREDIPRQYLVKLIATASANVRTVLEATNPQAVAAIRDAVDEVADAMRRAAHAPARTEQIKKTAAALAKLGPFPVDLVERALLDEGVEMVLVLAKAARCTWVVAKDLLMMFLAGRSLSPHDLQAASASFERMSPETAQRIVKFREQRAKFKAQDAAATNLAVLGSVIPPG
jgi:uncharacterized protein (DUF2336 family)